jgi:hypothetical protein
MLVMDGWAYAGLACLACVAGDEDLALQRLMPRSPNCPPAALSGGAPGFAAVPRIRTTSSAIVALLARHRARLDGKILPDLSNAPAAHNM